jgi:hypothetical protein
MLHSAYGTVPAGFVPPVGDRKGEPSPKHKIRHTIETAGHPLFARALRLDPDKLRQAEAEFRQLEAAGIIRRSDSPWSLPLHMVRKKDGSWRPCGDYRCLNLAMTHDRYPLPSILDLSNKLHGCKFFSCIDLVKGYHQIPMAAQDIAKTAIITPFGLFEHLFMPFGLPNTTQTFQHFMDRLFKHLPFVFCYLDNLIIASHTLQHQEHQEHLQKIFTILQENFLPGIARTLQPLTNALRGDPKTLVWPPVAAFDAAKAALAAAVPLVHPAPNAVLSLATDASHTHVGGMLQLLAGVSWQPLAFYSKKLSGAGTRYSTFYRELLAAFSTVRHFRFLLEGRRFCLLTDHKPLVTSLFCTTPPWSACQ